MSLFAVSIGDSLQQGFDEFFAFLPRLIGFLLILLIGYIIARAVRTVVSRVLQGVGADRALHSGTAGQYVNRVAPTLKPSETLGALAFWFIFLGAIAIAVGQLGIATLTNFVQSIGDYLPNVVAAILIFLIAGVVAAAIGGLVARTMGDTPTGKVVGSVVPVLVMAIATFMILNQLRIAPEIVTITYAALIGAAALALALAFGLGGREVAAQMLSDAYVRGQRASDQVKQDAQLGKERAQQDVERATQQGQSRVGDGQAPAGTGASAARRAI
jgi:uncharacterized membrane protein